MIFVVGASSLLPPFILLVSLNMFKKNYQIWHLHRDYPRKKIMSHDIGSPHNTLAKLIIMPHYSVFWPIGNVIKFIIKSLFFYCIRQECHMHLPIFQYTCNRLYFSIFLRLMAIYWKAEIPNVYFWGAFHQAFCQCFSLTTVISYWNPCIWLAESKFVSETHWQNAWWNAPQVLYYWLLW